jgi:ligand-binding sensor domain-containing protein
MNMKQILLQLMLFVTVLPVLRAQSPWFQQHGMGEAFPKARAELVYESRNSLLWFGTTDGLFMFDGLDFTPFLKKDSTSNHVRAIYQDAQKRLWVGYEDGSIFYLENHQLSRWTPEEGTPAVAVTGFAEDAQGRLWFSTYGEGVYYRDGAHLYNIGTDDGLLGADIYVMTRDKTGRMWLGTDGGISICSFSNGKKQVKNLTRDDGLPDDIVREIIPDSNGNMWIGTYDRGVCVFNTSFNRFEYPLKDWNYGIVNRLELFEEQELWIGTEGHGVWRYSLHDGSLQALSLQKSIERAKVYDLHKDIEGNIWLLTNTLGISSANRQFEVIPTTFENQQAILVSRQGTLWLGTPEGLFLHRLDEHGNSFFEEVLKNLNLNVVSLFEDRFDQLWIGTFEKGVFCFNPKTGKTRQFTERDGLSNDNVLSIDGVNGHIWLATLGGVTEIENQANILTAPKPVMRNFKQADGLGTNFIYKVFIDSKGRTWFGTDGQGISVLDKGVIKNYTSALPSTEPGHENEDHQLKAVYSITEDQQGHIWLSTAKQGIFEFDGEKFNHLTVKEGIRDLAITSLATAANGQIVIVHPTGIDLLTPETHHLIYYDEEVGISNIDPNLNAVCRDRWGNVWIAVRNGVIKYTPLKEHLEIHPRTLITGVSVFLGPVDFQNINEFSHSQNNLVFDYVGLWYTNPGTVKYRYKLEGYDLGWILSKDRRATYSNLPPGQYTFKVTSTENDAWLDEPVIEWSFEILPPVWMRWWFICLCSAVLAGLFYWYQKARDQRLRRVHLLEKDKAESELAAIKAQINPHFLFNSFNTLITVIEEDPATAVEYVEKLSDFYRSMMQLRDKEVISLQEEVELVQHYGYLLQKRYGENFHLNVSLNGSAAYVVPLSLQILVENAVKHNVISKAKPLTVDIQMEGRDYVAVVNNLQPKVKPEKSTRFGLQSLTRRYELLSGKKVKVETSKTHFKVSIPVIE